MAKFRKKPVVIEAMQYTGQEALNTVFNWVAQESRGGASGRVLYEREAELHILTLEGEMHVSVGDWIIKGVKGEFYPCKPDIFEATYEALEEGEAW